MSRAAATILGLLASTPVLADIAEPMDFNSQSMGGVEPGPGGWLVPIILAVIIVGSSALLMVKGRRRD